jgi:TonB family protein
MRKKPSSRKSARISRPSQALCFALLSLFALTTTAPTSHAQTESNARKLLYRVEPEYPADLKRIGIGGYVRVEATISPSGAVEDATIAGGNPILAEAAVKAVKKWKYAPLDSKTKAKLLFHFSP